MNDELNAAMQRQVEQVSNRKRRGDAGAFTTDDSGSNLVALAVDGMSGLANGIAGAGRAVGERFGKMIPGGRPEDGTSTSGGFTGGEGVESARSGISRLGNSVARAASTVADSTGSMLATTTEGIGRMVAAAGEGLGQVTASAGSIAAGTGDVLASVGHLEGNVLSTVVDAAGPVAEAAGDAAGSVLGGIGEIFN